MLELEQKGLVRAKKNFPCEKMKGLSQNAYVYTLEECVGLENFFFSYKYRRIIWCIWSILHFKVKSKKFKKLLICR